MTAVQERGADGAMGAGRRRFAAMASSYGLLALGGLLILGFSLALPNTFPTGLTVRSILNNQTTTLLLALALTIVIASREFDLSIGYVVGLTHVLVIGFVIKNGLSWPISVLLVLLISVAIGTFNGVLVHYAHIDSFIATLGTGTVAYGISIWYTGGQQIVSPLPHAFVNLAQQNYLGIPLPAFIAAAIAIALWVLLDYTSTGRRLYALGFNRRAAELSGISAKRYGVAAFTISGFLVGIAGILLAARLQVAQSDTGPEFLLPAFVGALLGKTAIRPGRPNVWGTVVAVLVLAVGISGLELLGGQFYVENLFNGSTLIIAVGVAGVVTRRRVGSNALPPQVAEPDQAKPDQAKPDHAKPDQSTPTLLSSQPTPDQPQRESLNPAAGTPEPTRPLQR